MPRLLVALLVTLTFAVMGWIVGGVTLSGAIAGFVIAFALYYCIGPGAFAVLLAVFGITWIATRFGKAHREKLGIFETRRGRDAGQVLANLGTSAVLAVVGMYLFKGLAWAAAVAALCEAAADTASSECGEAWSDHAYLILGFRRVPAGNDGAISVVGTIVAIVAAALVASVAALEGVLTLRLAAIAALAGFLGTLIDSFLGATLETRSLIGNNSVNFLSTFSAAVIASLLSFV
jgi:uncharacterized protein (TIGR00297 family)